MLLKTILKKSKIFCQVKDMFLKTSFLLISSNSSNFFFTNGFLIEKRVYTIQILSQLLPIFFKYKFYSLFKTVFFYFFVLNFSKNYCFNLLKFLLFNRSNFFYYYDIRNHIFCVSTFFDFFDKCNFMVLYPFIGFLKSSSDGNFFRSFLVIGIFFLFFLVYYKIFNTFLILLYNLKNK